MKTRGWFTIYLLIMLTVCMLQFNVQKIDAATELTKYSDKHLQNGSFEEGMDSSFSGSTTYVQPAKGTIPYWDTTAIGGKFEFFTNDSPHFNDAKNAFPNNPEYRNVAQGKVAAELNADEVSTIYQRVNTIAGSTYTWGLSHRGRSKNGVDRMVLFIGPEQSVDPSKPAKDGQDQFVRITNWLKKQYGVEYLETGCSRKYIVYSKPFAANGKFEGEGNSEVDEDQVISLEKTDAINQEWSVWVISSPYCNTSTKNTINGWSRYGTNALDDFDDIMKGESSTLGYDCTYTVPNGQTHTLFAFCSYASGNGSATYGNLLDDINFDLYQPFSTSTTPGGQGNVENITSDITSGNPLYTTVLDGQYCTIYTSAVTNGSITGCTFKGAYITQNNADGTSSTRFVQIYTGAVNEEDRENLLEHYFLVNPNNSTQYYYKVSVGSPVSIHLIYEKAPFVLYDANGGADYYFSPDNTAGGNMVGFGKDFVKIFDKVVDDQDTYIDTSAYYKNYDATAAEEENKAGFYISHSALPNASWDQNDDPDIADNPYRFCGWKVLDVLDSKIVLDGVHRIEYKPTGDDINTGIITITDSNNTVNNLQLDASNGVTLSAIWKFANRAYAQTLNSNGVFENSAVGGTVEETMISNNLRENDVKNYTDSENRVSKVYAFGSAGDTIMFKATADYANNYKFVGWYKREKQADNTYKEVLKSTATSIAVTVEEGKLGTYYARFQKMDNPVVFYYSASGSADGYDFYDKSTEKLYGKYFQDVAYGGTAVKPTGDSNSVQTWFTSRTERSAEYIFNFNTPITQETHLYAGPTFAYNYYNDFVFREPWRMHTYGTLKIGNSYIDLKDNTDVTDYNVYMLKGTLDEENVPSPAMIRNNANTTKIGMAESNAELLFNTLTNTGQAFNRIGAAYENIYLFNMKTPVWVMFDFTYKGVTYTSTVKDRSLYNNITTYMDKASNGLYTTFPPETQAELRGAQKTLLEKIQGLYQAVEPLDITEPSRYADASSVTSLQYDSNIENPYTFSSTTAIRNIEPWGLKYSFTVSEQTVTDFVDYGAVVLTDRTGELKEASVSVSDLLANTNSVMYSRSKENVYTSNDGAVEIYYVNDLYASDFDKPTYVVFFVKDTNGKYYFSPVVQKTYNSLAEIDKNNSESAYKDVSNSILEYSSALTTYLNLLKQAETGQSTSPVA